MIVFQTKPWVHASLCLLVSIASVRAETSDDLYKCAIEQLKKNDCVSARNCWERYKDIFKEEFYKNPQAGRRVEDAITNCKSGVEIEKVHRAEGGASTGARPIANGNGAASGTIATVAIAVVGLAAVGSASSTTATH
jgi:lysozyme family protein